MRQHEANCCLIRPSVLVGQDITTRAMASLVIVVIDEGKRVFGCEKTPSRSPVHQPPQLVTSLERLAKFQSEFELCDGGERSIFVSADRLATEVDNFLVDVRASSRGEAVVCVEVAETAVDNVEIAGPHVLGCVDSESGIVDYFLLSFVIKYNIKEEVVYSIYQDR